jgi:alkanesulfonate monooxygenase SsuD/methylene tetrahydromethanopterin reductase-like flavin-dependent oxidoreductase (luciferase family)
MAARGIEVGITFGPTGLWGDVLAGARQAEALDLDAVGFWDHYHSENPDWALTCGWSAYGYLAVVTERLRLVPMVLCAPNHLPGVLAKESSILQIASGGRFELGIGAGDFPKEFSAWGVPFESADVRMARLGETVAALREIWQGGLVTFTGEHLQLDAAACTPVPSEPPRVVVGVGNSRRLIDQAVAWADELNVYGDETSMPAALEAVARSGRAVDVSVFVWRGPEGLPDDLAGDLRRWRDQGITRAFVTVGWDDDVPAVIEQVAAAKREANAA